MLVLKEAKEWRISAQKKLLKKYRTYMVQNILGKNTY